MRAISVLLPDHHEFLQQSPQEPSDVSTATSGMAEREIVEPEGSGEAALPQKGKPRPRYPQHLQQAWHPEHAN
jgi:hypothetical protein